MKKIYIPFVVFCIVLACLLCPLTASAATLSYNTSDFLAPIISDANGAIVKHPSSLHYPNGEVANFYWCGTNTQGAYTFGNVWKTYTNRTAPQGYAEEMWLNFYLASTGAYVGDFVHFETNISFMFPDYEVLEVFLIPAFDDGVSAQRRTIFSNTNGTWTGAINWTGSFTSFACYPDDNSTVAETRKVCDGFVLSVSLRHSNYPENSTSYPYSKGLWVQFSKDSIFFSGSNIEYENMLSQKENNKLLTEMNANQAETNKQLEEANDSLDNIAGNQEETNEKLDSLGNKQDKTNQKLDALTDEQEKTNDILTEEKYEITDFESAEDYYDSENELLEDGAEGREDALGILDGLDGGLQSVARGLVGANKIFDAAFVKIDFITPLVYISLALGFFSFILSLANTFVGTLRSESARKEREAKNDAWREKVFNENKRYHDGMLSRRGK